MLALACPTPYSHSDRDTVRRKNQFTLGRRSSFEVAHFLVPEGRHQIAWGASPRDDYLMPPLRGWFPQLEDTRAGLVKTRARITPWATYFNRWIW